MILSNLEEMGGAEEWIKKKQEVTPTCIRLFVTPAGFKPATF